MAIVQINSETDLETYFNSFRATIPALKSVVYVDTDADLDELVGNYFKNKYKGTVLLVGIMEEKVKLGHRTTWTAPQIGLTVLSKYDKQRPDTLSAVREETKAVLIKALHKIKDDREDSAEAVENYDETAGDVWDFAFLNEVILPVGDVANAGCRGWLAEIEIGWPMSNVR